MNDYNTRDSHKQNGPTFVSTKPLIEILIRYILNMTLSGTMMDLKVICIKKAFDLKSHHSPLSSYQ